MNSFKSIIKRNYIFDLYSTVDKWYLNFPQLKTMLEIAFFENYDLRTISLA